jgi:hypothetical protein
MRRPSRTSRVASLAHARSEPGRGWRVERVGWALTTLLVVAATLGLFGDGPLARASASVADGTSVRYERFARTRRPVDIEAVRPARADSARVRVSEEFLRAVDLLAVDPPPSRWRVAGGERIYEFEGATSSVILRVEYRRAGRVAGSIAWGAAAPVTFSTLVFP